MLRRQMLAAALVLAAAPAFGQAWPTKPITMIVPFATGGPTDLLARIIGERMGKELGQQFIIENVTGAAGTIAMAKLARSAPDGYTIGIGHVGTNVANAVIYTKIGFDLLADLEPVARLGDRERQRLPERIRQQVKPGGAARPTDSCGQRMRIVPPVGPMQLDAVPRDRLVLQQFGQRQR